VNLKTSRISETVPDQTVEVKQQQEEEIKQVNKEVEQEVVEIKKKVDVKPRERNELEIQSMNGMEEDKKISQDEWTTVSKPPKKTENKSWKKNSRGQFDKEKNRKKKTLKNTSNGHFQEAKIIKAATQEPPTTTEERKIDNTFFPISLTKPGELSWAQRLRKNSVNETIENGQKIETASLKTSLEIPPPKGKVMLTEFHDSQKLFEELREDIPSLDLKVHNFLGVGLELLSAAQLTSLEELHTQCLNKITQAKVAKRHLQK